MDFALFGPYGRRAAVLQRFEAQVFVDGALHTKRMKGPSNFDSWLACWQVFRAAMLMCKAASPATLDGYAEGIRQLITLFPTHWGTISRADEAIRSEKWGILSEKMFADSAKEHGMGRPEMNCPRCFKWFSGGHPSEGSGCPSCNAGLVAGHIPPWDIILRATQFGTTDTSSAAAGLKHWWDLHVVHPCRGASPAAAGDLINHLEVTPCAQQGSTEAPQRRRRTQG